MSAPTPHQPIEQTKGLSPRAAAALRALADYTHGEPHESLCERSGLSHGSWQRAVVDLKRAGLAVSSIERMGRVVRACYSLTPEGVLAASTQPSLGSVGSVVGCEMGSVGYSSFSSYSLFKPKAEEKKEEQPTRPTTEPSDAAHRAHAAQTGDAAMLDTVRLLMEPVMRMVEAQGKTLAAVTKALEYVASSMPGAPPLPCPCESPREWKTSKAGERYLACLRGRKCPYKPSASDPKRAAETRAAILAVDQRTPEQIAQERRGVRPSGDRGARAS